MILTMKSLTPVADVGRELPNSVEEPNEEWKGNEFGLPNASLFDTKPGDNVKEVDEIETPSQR